MTVRNHNHLGLLFAALLLKAGSGCAIVKKDGQSTTARVPHTGAPRAPARPMGTPGLNAATTGNSLGPALTTTPLGDEVPPSAIGSAVKLQVPPAPLATVFPEKGQPNAMTVLDETRECAVESMGGRLRVPLELRWFEVGGTRLEKKAFSMERGNVTIINFWASWCEPCKKEMPTLLRLQKHLKEFGPSLVFISEDTDGAEIERYQKQNNLNFPTFVSPTGEMRSLLTAGAQKGPGLPLTIVVDGDGRLRGCLVGELDSRDLNNILFLTLMLLVGRGR